MIRKSKFLTIIMLWVIKFVCLDGGSPDGVHVDQDTQTNSDVREGVLNFFFFGLL